MKSLTLALFIAAVANVPAAEAVFFPLSLQPGGPLQAGLPYTFRISPATVVGDTVMTLKAVVRGRLRSWPACERNGCKPIGKERMH